MRKEYGPGPPITDSSTSAPSEVNANTELYMRIWSWNLTALFSLLVKRTYSSGGVAGRFGNWTLPFSQHKENCGLLFVEFANRSLIHIFALQNPHILSISPQSHHLGANASSSPNNCNAWLWREGYSRCLARHSLCRRLWRSCADFDVPLTTASPSPNNCNASLRREGYSRCLARRSLWRQLRRSCADSNVPWADACASPNNLRILGRGVSPALFEEGEGYIWFLFFWNFFIS